MSDPATVEELPVLQSIATLKIKNGDVLVVKLHTTNRLPDHEIKPMMVKQKKAWTEILRKAGLSKCQVVVITDAADLSVIEVVSQLAAP